jgi:hypothetical protein
MLDAYSDCSSIRHYSHNGAGSCNFDQLQTWVSERVPSAEKTVRQNEVRERVG